VTLVSQLGELPRHFRFRIRFTRVALEIWSRQFLGVGHENRSPDPPPQEIAWDATKTLRRSLSVLDVRKTDDFTRSIVRRPLGYPRGTQFKIGSLTVNPRFETVLDRRLPPVSLDHIKDMLSQTLTTFVDFMR
jgi:hypothetical protein